MSQREPTGNEASERIAGAEAILDANVTMAIAACADDGPWVAKVFFVVDEPSSGSFDLCCYILASAARQEMLATHPQVAFVVGGDEPERWLTGVGRLELIADDGDAAAMLKRLEEKVPAAGPFLAGLPSTAVRIHVERLKVTDLRAEPPVAEFTFA